MRFELEFYPRYSLVQSDSMVHLTNNLWLIQSGRNRPTPMLEDLDFWASLARAVWIDASRPVTVLELLSAARIFGSCMDAWLAELKPAADYETWVSGLLATQPEPSGGEFRIEWQPVLRGSDLQEWYRCVPVGLNLSEDKEAGVSHLLDLYVVLNSNYSLYNDEGERVFYTHKPFRLMDVLVALLEFLFYFEGPNERSVYLELTRRTLRTFFETQRQHAS